jgi:hypothetical protein
MEGMKRPEAIVLPDSALIPSNCLISPPPNQFTHEVTRSQAFYASHGTPSGPPTGQFDAGTKVVLLYYDGKEFCRVVDAAGHYVDTLFDGLRKL